MASIDTSFGILELQDTGGSGPAALFAHGFAVDGGLWRDVVDRLDGVRCVVPTLPLGAHTRAVPAAAPLTPRGVAGLLVELSDALGLDEVVLVGNDTGGALCQLAAADHLERFAGMVLTNCDLFDRFPPPPFNVLFALARIPGGLQPLRIGLRSRRVFDSPLAFGLLSHRRIPDDLADRWRGPVTTDAAIFADVVRFLRAVEPQELVAADERLRGLRRPVTFAWGVDDRLFRLRDAERLAAMLPDARVEPIERARTFVPLDQPAAVADAVRAQVAKAARAPAGTSPAH